jgi:hypothetical protein
MEVQLNTNVNSVAAAAGSARSKKADVQATSSEAAFEDSAALNAALQQTPDVRPEAVARGKALVETESKNYPPVETINKIAALLAVKLDE